jgi:hypothetical protein
MYLKHCIVWPIDQDNKNNSAKVFEELQKLVLKENGQDKMVRENN